MSVAAISIEEKQSIKKRSYKPLLWVGIAGMTMLFAGLLSAYVVRHAQGNWLYFELPSLFYYSTTAIVLSSISMIWAMNAAKKNEATISLAVFIAFLLGVTFVILQFKSWAALVAQGIFFTGGESNASGSFLFVLSGMHLAHLAAGIIVLFVTWVMALKRKYNSENILGLELASIYWHFLTVLWVFLFAFLHYIR